MNFKDYKKIKDALYAWAWYHQYTVRTETTAAEKYMWYVKCILVKKHRERDYG